MFSKSPEAPPTVSGPKGLGIGYMLDTDSVTRPQSVPKATDKGFVNPHVQYVTGRTTWDKLEPAEGAFYWGFLDGVAASAAANGKKFSLTIAAGVNTPQWVYDAGARSMTITNEDETRPIPLLWDSVFQDKWGNMISELSSRYGSDNLGYVDLTVGYKVEGFYVQSPADIAVFNALGGLDSWQDGVKWMIDKMAFEFFDTPFTLVLGAPVPGTEGKAALQAVCDYGVANHPGNHFACSSHGLLYPRGPGTRSIGATMCQLLSPTSTPGFQLSTSVKGDRLDKTLGMGAGFGAKFIEVYSDACNASGSGPILDKWAAVMTA